MKSDAAEMHAVCRVEADLVDDACEFFAPVASDLIDVLLGRYAGERAKVERIAHLFSSEEHRGPLQYFFKGNASDNSRSPLSCETLFALTGALFALNSRYWAEALALTDVYDCMPQARRDYWNAQLQGEKFLNDNRRSSEPVAALPDFEEDTVRNTLADLLRQRSEFFAERVDGIFRGLSSHHVTNEPQGFGKRMIIEGMLLYGSIRHERSGLINDLRCVVAKFMGRTEPKYNSSDTLVRELYRTTGQWVSVDGGALRIRVYKKGTAHLEVHPEMAWRLNKVLASLYPLAIPAEFRTKPKKRSKDFLMMGRPLPFATLELLAASLNKSMRYVKAEDRFFAFSPEARQHKASYDDACNVLAALGGVVCKSKFQSFEFDYPIAPVLNQVILTGCLPDQKAHQYYPTPDKLARLAAELAGIGELDTVLEPSAGQGGLAAHLPQERTTCIEIAPLHCEVLRAKGFNTVIEADFLTYAQAQTQGALGGQAGFDCVVMNPPFSEGRAKLHTEAASTLVKPGGRLVAILPASMRGKAMAGMGRGWTLSWSSVFDNEFAGTSAAVCILKATHLPESD